MTYPRPADTDSMVFLARPSAVRLAGIVALVAAVAVAGMMVWVVMQDRAYDASLERTWQAQVGGQRDVTRRMDEYQRAQQELRDDGLAPAARAARQQRLHMQAVRGDIRRDAASLEAASAPRRWERYHTLAIAQRAALVERLDTDIALADHVIETLGSQPSAAQVRGLSGDAKVRLLMEEARQRAEDAERAQRRLDAAAPPFEWLPFGPDGVAPPAFSRLRFRLPEA